MQNFSSSPAPFPSGFTRGSPYPPHPSDPQISPQMTEDYVGMQQAQNPQNHGQHPLLRGQNHPGQVAHIHGYGSRRGAGDIPQANAHGGSSTNSYRKENTDYYFSMSGRDRGRRLPYGAGYGYSNMDGHITHQYRHVSGSGSSSGMMSPYTLDYGTAAGSGVSSSNNSGTGSFSPSQHYSIGQNPSMQLVSGPQMHQRHHGQKYPSHQGLPQGHRGYSVSGQRMPPQFGHYPPINTTTGSGMYSPPPQRYEGSSSGGIDSKMNNSPTHSNPNSVSNSVVSNNTGHQEGMGQSYSSGGHPPYSPQSHAVKKHTPLSQRPAQHGPGTGYDPSVKMQHHPSGPAYPKPPQSTVPTNPAMPHHPTQEISKSPMHSQTQQTHMNPNFSPISNPSPAASAVQSPSCSSSSSPLMGVADGQGNASAPVVQTLSHSSHQTPRGGQSHGRLLQTVPQLSPTPNSNSSISSCGSSAGSKSAGLIAGLGSGHATLNSNRMGIGSRVGPREESSSSLYQSCPQDKVMQDTGLNSLSALTSQVANLPNTVQHMLLTDTLLSQRKGKDGGQHNQMQQPAHAISSSLSKARTVSAPSGQSTGSEDGGVTGGHNVSSEAEDRKIEQGDPSSALEMKRSRQMSGTSSESEPTSYYPSPQTHSQTGQSRHGLHQRVDTAMTKTPFKHSSSHHSNTFPVAQAKTTDPQTPSSSPPSVPPSAEPSPSQPPCPPAPSVASSSTPSPTHSLHSNSLAEPDSANIDDQAGVRESKKIKDESQDENIDTNQKNKCMEQEGERVINHPRQDHEKELSSHPKKKEDKRKDQMDNEQNCDNSNNNMNTVEQHNSGGVGVIVSTRSDFSNTESTKNSEVVPMSPQYGSQHCPEEKHSTNLFRDSKNHNGEGDFSMDAYAAQYEVSSKPDFRQNTLTNHAHPGSFKYGNPELPYNACMSAKTGGKGGSAGGIGANSHYQGYHHPQTNYSAVARKEAGVESSLKRGVGVTPRGQETNSQLQQPFPSLLQEVLQGYHLDRRYGRSELIPSAHHQAQNMSQFHYQNRPPYAMMENMRSHGMSSQSGIAHLHHGQLATGKPQMNQNQGPGTDLGPGLPHPSWDSDTQKPKVGSSDKNKSNASPSINTHGQQSDSKGPPTKHINLADYSLPHRKPSNVPMPSSAVQQLLLQESEPLAGTTGPICPSRPQTSSASHSASLSGRRSVICDVSPSCRTTPEREKNQLGSTGPSVIQQPLTSIPTEGCIKEEVREKQEQDMEEAPDEHSGQSADSFSARTAKEVDIPEHNKSIQPPTEINSDLQPGKGIRGNIDLTSPYHSQHDLSSNHPAFPSRRQTYPQASDGTATSYASYGFGETREGNLKLNLHYPAHHPYHTSPQSQNPPTSSKLHPYPHPISHQQAHSLDDRLDWASQNSRPKEMSIASNSSSDRHIPQSQSEQKLQSPTDAITNQQHLHRQQLPYSSSYYDLKMWENYSERDGAGMSEGESFRRNIQGPPPVPPESVVSQPALIPGSKHAEPEALGKSLHPSTASNSTGPTSSNVVRQVKTGGSGETNPLMMRRRVRSFISPIPAKRQHQDLPNQRGGSSYPPLPYSENDLSGMDTPRPKVASPNSPYASASTNSLSQSSSPPQSKTKILPPRKGRGLKLEAIVQKITPSVKKISNYNNSHVDSDPDYFSEVSHYSSEIPDQDIGAPFSRVPHGEGLPYLDEAHSIEELMPYRAVEETTYSCDSQGLKQTTPSSLQTEFDFGLGPAGSSGSCIGDSDKDDFTLLGPLPPAPPLPRPVQGSPPPSSSALSDIQQFTNTYQQLETRRGEQSAANLLRQKLQETGMGFDDYSAGDYYGATPPHHSQSPVHHLLSRSQMASARMQGMDLKSQDSVVPKGYFPSGKKKGRPVGSVNKQKRTQAQLQTSITSAPTASSAITPVAPQIIPTVVTTIEVPTTPTPADQKPCSTLVPPQPQTQTVKVDVESEDTQAEIDVKPIRHRQRKSKEDTEVAGLRGRQRRRRRGVTELPSMEELDTQAGSGGSTSGIFPDGRNNGFSPYIHVERKVAEIGAVCTIVNAEDEKSKGEKAGSSGAKGSGIDALSTVSVTVQPIRKEKEIEKVKEKRAVRQVDTSLQAGKTLPTSGFVLSGPVISESSHTGRFLCCLCQKWANYKNLGDLYGPFYPSDYDAKLPKSNPQIRQVLSVPGGSIPNLPTNSTKSSSQLLDNPIIKSSTDSDCTVSQATNPASPATTIGTSSPGVGEEMPIITDKATSVASKSALQNWELMPEVTLIPGTIKQSELEVESSQNKQQIQTEDTQQRSQHRKLTSHPRFKRRHKSSEDLPRTIPINSKASLPFQPPPPTLDSLGPLAQLAQLPLVPLDPEELWVHEGCIVWASGVYLVNGRLYGLQEALDGARDTSCSHCDMVGSTLGCYTKGCTLRYHYLCAMEADCSLNEENFSMRCLKHKFPQNMRPSKVGATYLEQSERG